MSKCTAPDCNNEVIAKGMCNKHYYQVKRGGTLELSVKQLAALRKCSIESCGRPHVANNYCAMHNRRFKRHGDPLFINPKCNRDGNYIKRARAKTAKWKKEHPALTSFYTSQRKQAIKQATPKWLDLSLLEVIHINKPEGYEVDHIFPIKGENISGLNVPWNLQYLTPSDNNSKNNKFDWTYDNESWRNDFNKER